MKRTLSTLLEEDLGLPIQFNQDKLTKFEIAEDYLDTLEIYTLKRKKNLLYLAPDTGTKMFAQIFNSKKYKAFEVLASNILLSADNINIFYHINYPVINKYTKQDQLIISETIKITKTKKENIDENCLIFIEYDEHDFGHYGGMYFDKETNNLYTFDSMMQYLTESQEVYSPYMDSFLEIIKKSFNNNFNNFNIYYDITPTERNFSLEITGGTFNKNPFINKSENETYYKDIYILGVDTQNQYCYMWTILYLLSKTVSNLFFQDLYKKIFELDLIPVVVIKIFCYLIVNYFKPIQSNYTSDYNSGIELLKQEDFNEIYRYISSNAEVYSQVFNTFNQNFNIYKINFNLFNMDITTDLKKILIDFNDILKYTILCIPDRQDYEKCIDKNTYYNIILKDDEVHNLLTIVNRNIGIDEDLESLIDKKNIDENTYMFHNEYDEFKYNDVKISKQMYDKQKYKKKRT